MEKKEIRKQRNEETTSQLIWVDDVILLEFCIPLTYNDVTKISHYSGTTSRWQCWLKYRQQLLQLKKDPDPSVGEDNFLK